MRFRPPFLLAVASVLLFISGGLLCPGARAGNNFPASWQPLVRALRLAGYDVRFENPPVAGAYGATNARKKIIWVAPISVQMGIGRQTMIHEAVHAAQACPTGKYQTIGWSVSLPNAVDRSIEGILYRKYPHKKFPVEREAFFMQSHPNAFVEVIKALKQRCN